MLDLDDDWVWDFWTVDDPDHGPERYHLFFLKAPRSLGDPERRHRNASIGHAVSADLRAWRRIADAVLPQPAPAFDDLATWSGSVVQDPSGQWLMFTTGVTHTDGGLVQRIGMSASDDLIEWSRSPAALLEADDRWYDRGRGVHGEEHWRDPWVVADTSGLWHMYVTAQAPGRLGQGVVGHATSPDLHTWQIQPPLSRPTGRFDQLEVISLHCIDSRWVLLFSCLHPEIRGAEPGGGGVWAVPVDGPGSTVDIDRATRVTSERLYVGKIIDDDHGRPQFLAFENRGDADEFRGGIVDPCAIAWNRDGTGLDLIGAPDSWLPETNRRQ